MSSSLTLGTNRKSGAPTWARTRDRLLKRELLYQLSYRRVRKNIAEHSIVSICWGGEIGRRTRLRIWRRKAWRFESSPQHLDFLIVPCIMDASKKVFTLKYSINAVLTQRGAIVAESASKKGYRIDLPTPDDKQITTRGRWWRRVNLVVSSIAILGGPYYCSGGGGRSSTSRLVERSQDSESAAISRRDSFQTAS